MTKKYYLLKALASLLAMIFGFSATVAAQYGAIETTYKINGNINDLLSNVPIANIKVSMKSQDNASTTVQSDSLGHFEFAMYQWALDNTYYFTAEDIDGGAGGGDYLPKDTTLPLGYEDFQRGDPRGHWQVEKTCRYQVNLKLPKAVFVADTVNAPVNPPADSSEISPQPILLPRDTLLLSTAEVAAQDPTDEWATTEVYPNPTNGLVEIVIEVKLAEEIRLQLYDDTYKVLLERTEQLQSGSNKFSLDLKEYATGNYFLAIIRRDNKVVKKIVKI
jgi:putative lipoprotein (rSAM/lipoprotein system)